MYIPERALWVAVIERAMKDAAGEIESGHMKHSTRNYIIRKAQAWFRKGDQHFQAICDLVGVEPSRVRARAMKNFETVPKQRQRPRKRVLTSPSAMAA